MPHVKEYYMPSEEVLFIHQLRSVETVRGYLNGLASRAVDAAGKPLDAGLREMWNREARLRIKRLQRAA